MPGSLGVGLLLGAAARAASGTGREADEQRHAERDHRRRTRSRCRRRAPAGAGSTIAIAVPISWPTTMSPTVAWLADAADLARSPCGRRACRPRRTSLPWLTMSSHLSSGRFEGRGAAGELLADPDRRRTAPASRPGPARATRAAPPAPPRSPPREVDVGRQDASPSPRPGCRLDREREAAVEPEAVVEHGAHERRSARRRRRRAAVDEVLPGQPIDVASGTAPRRSRVVGLPSAISPSAMPGMSTSLDRVDEARAGRRAGSPLSCPTSPRSRNTSRLRRGLRHEVAGMRVAVEEAVDEDLLDDRPDERGARARRCRSRPRAAPSAFETLMPGDELHRQDARVPTGRRRRAAR